MSSSKKTKKTVKARPDAPNAKTARTKPEAKAKTATKPARKAEAAPAKPAKPAKPGKAAKPVVKDVRSAAKPASKAASRPKTSAATAEKTKASGKAKAKSVKPAETKPVATKPTAAKSAAAAPAKAKSAPVKSAPAAKSVAPKAKKDIELPAAAMARVDGKVVRSEAIKSGATQTIRQQQIAPVPPSPAASASVTAVASAAKPPAAPAPVLKTSSTSDRTQVTEKKIDTAAVPKIKSEPTRTSAVKPAKPTNQRQGFKTNEFIVYPAHGVGQIVGIEEQEVAGFKLELFVISFAKDKMTLKVPTPKAPSVGMRKLAEANVVRKALDTLTGRARIKRTMWSRRAQEYEAKINSGDLVAIAEVVRDLYRSEAQPEQSYSERQLYEAALDRMAREIAAVNKLIESESLKLIESQLQKGPRRGGKADVEVEADEIEAEGGVDEAA
jgi:CarD family transcriptional regulator